MGRYKRVVKYIPVNQIVKQYCLHETQKIAVNLCY